MYDSLLLPGVCVCVGVCVWMDIFTALGPVDVFDLFFLRLFSFRLLSLLRYAS